MKHAPGLLVGSVIALGCSSTLPAQEKPAERPKIIAVSPLTLMPGANVHLKIRGLKLRDATEVRVSGAPAGVRAEIVEKKAAEVPNGLDGKLFGDTLVEVTLPVPDEPSAVGIHLSVITPSGTTPTAEVRIALPGSFVPEKEPNNGFREAQPTEFKRTIFGTVKEDKDVDVFRFAAQSGQRIVAEIFAARGPSLLDPVLTLCTAQGQILATSDDSLGRDARLEARLTSTGDYLLVVQDAHDRGTVWHGYELMLGEAE